MPVIGSDEDFIVKSAVGESGCRQYFPLTQRLAYEPVRGTVPYAGVRALPLAAASLIPPKPSSPLNQYPTTPPPTRPAYVPHRAL